MPMYGQSFTLSSSSVNGLNAASSGAGAAGPFTAQAGFLAYFEICYMVKNEQWTVAHEPGMGPYAYKGNQWVGYDDQEIIREKVFISRSNLMFDTKK